MRLREVSFHMRRRMPPRPDAACTRALCTNSSTVVVIIMTRASTRKTVSMMNLGSSSDRLPSSSLPMPHTVWSGEICPMPPRTSATRMTVTTADHVKKCWESSYHMGHLKSGLTSGTKQFTVSMLSQLSAPVDPPISNQAAARQMATSCDIMLKSSSQMKSSGCAVSDVRKMPMMMAKAHKPNMVTTYVGYLRLSFTTSQGSTA
mmetsp:Transcript_22324/g.56034  ORF Transcript_22324/g.56034 Transcript_22324/m.56034 type:complete len:204 (-) Transcript_22324:856-1467(-)